MIEIEIQLLGHISQWHVSFFEEGENIAFLFISPNFIIILILVTLFFVPLPV
jgi:hypothetical protein